MLFNADGGSITQPFSAASASPDNSVWFLSVPQFQLELSAAPLHEKCEAGNFLNAALTRP